VNGLHRLSRVSARALGLGAIALLLPFLVSGCIGGPSVVSAARTLTVTPAGDLKNQVVLVRWTGFTPSNQGANTVTIYQCKGSPKSLDDCYQLIRPPAGTNALGTGIDNAITLADGSGSAFLEIRPALDLPSLDCSKANACSVVAFENDGSPFPATGLPKTAATAKLTFAPSPADCPHVSSYDVVTGGEGSAAHALYSWAATTCTSSSHLSVDYTESSSPSGRRDFREGNVDIGITSMPANPTTEPSPRTYTYAPLDVSGVVVAFNATDTVTGQRITDMTLTPRLVALLIAGTQPGGPGAHLYQDPEFVRLNPGHSWPVNTQPPLLRAENNADTYLLTRWLQEDPAARQFLDGNDPNARVDGFWKGITYPTDVFEARNPSLIGSYNPRQGTPTNVRRLFNFQAPGDGVTVSPSIDGLLGIFDVVSATKFGLPIAKLVPANASAAPGVAPDTKGLAAGYAAMVPTSTGAVTKQANVQATAGAYPLTKIDYAMVPTSGIDATKAAHISGFLTFAAGDGQKPAHLPVGYLPLPAAEQPAVAAANAAVLAAPTATPDTTPTSTDTNNTTPDFSSDGDSFATSLGDVGLGGSDFSSAIDDNGLLVADGGTGGAAGASGTAKDRHTESAEPLSARFLGSQGRLVLPFVLTLGLAAVIAGPTMLLLMRRRDAATAAAGATAIEASDTRSIAP
jgi:hypothetical protein